MALPDKSVDGLMKTTNMLTDFSQWLREETGPPMHASDFLETGSGILYDAFYSY